MCVCVQRVFRLVPKHKLLMRVNQLEDVQLAALNANTVTHWKVESDFLSKVSLFSPATTSLTHSVTMLHCLVRSPTHRPISWGREEAGRRGEGEGLEVKGHQSGE